MLSWLDDLSCGPIANGTASQRAEWWAPFHGDRDIAAPLNAFWGRIATTEERLVIWFSRHRASELAFSLALADRLGDRTYEYVDVTGRQLPTTRRDGSVAVSAPVQSVGLVNPEGLRSLFGSEQSATPELQEQSGQIWRHLKKENAPFRIVTDAGLVSAPADCFDPLLRERAAKDWRSVVRIVAETMGYNSEPYIQVGEVMLLARVAALVGEGKLITDDDPRDMRSCRVRLPDQG